VVVIVNNEFSANQKNNVMAENYVKQNPIEWSVKAKCFDPKNPDEPCEKDIPIPVRSKRVMTGDPNTYPGVPIDANLAILFIQNFQKNYQIWTREKHEQHKKAVENRDFDILHGLFKTIEKRYKHHLKLTYGMTLNKDLLLKIVSQPRCESVRFYMCARPLGDGEMHLSLVTVGVDDEGYDLHYNLNGTVNDSVIREGVNDITTQSLTGEYTTPPPDDGTDGLNHALLEKDPLKIDKHYVLLRMANGYKGEQLLQTAAEEAVRD